jgi:hypothetical protein
MGNVSGPDCVERLARDQAPAQLAEYPVDDEAAAVVVGRAEIADQRGRAHAAEHRVALDQDDPRAQAGGGDGCGDAGGSAAADSHIGVTCWRLARFGIHLLLLVRESNR